MYLNLNFAPPVSYTYESSRGDVRMGATGVASDDFDKICNFVARNFAKRTEFCSNALSSDKCFRPSLIIKGVILQ